MAENIDYLALYLQKKVDSSLSQIFKGLCAEIGNLVQHWTLYFIGSLIVEGNQFN